MQRTRRMHVKNVPHMRWFRVGGEYYVKLAKRGKAPESLYKVERAHWDHRRFCIDLMHHPTKKLKPQTMVEAVYEDPFVMVGSVVRVSPLKSRGGYICVGIVRKGEGGMLIVPLVLVESGNKEAYAGD